MRKPAFTEEQVAYALRQALAAEEMDYARSHCTEEYARAMHAAHLGPSDCRAFLGYAAVGRGHGPARPGSVLRQPPTNVTEQLPGVTLDTLRAQKWHLEQQIRALASANSKRTTLAELIAQQETHPNKALPWLMRSFVQQRVKRGQSFADAKAGVLEVCALWIDKAHEQPDATDTDVDVAN